MVSRGAERNVSLEQPYPVASVWNDYLAAVRVVSVHVPRIGHLGVEGDRLARARGVRDGLGRPLGALEERLSREEANGQAELLVKILPVNLAGLVEGPALASRPDRGA